MDTLWELLARERRGEAIACRIGKESRVYDYDRFLTTTWQAGNYLRHFGVQDDDVVGIGSDAAPEPLFAALGTGLLGALVWFDPPLGADLRAIVVPAEDVEFYEGVARAQRITYGGSVADNSIKCFEEGLWKENPTIPPERPDSDTEIFTDGNRTYTQRQLLDAAARFEEEEDLDEGTTVVPRTSLGDSGTFVGILGTLRASATIVFPASESTSETKTVEGDIALGEGPEPRVIETDQIGPVHRDPTRRK